MNNLFKKHEWSGTIKPEFYEKEIEKEFLDKTK